MQDDKRLERSTKNWLHKEHYPLRDLMNLGERLILNTGAAAASSSVQMLNKDSIAPVRKIKTEHRSIKEHLHRDSGIRIFLILSNKPEDIVKKNMAVYLTNRLCSHPDITVSALGEHTIEIRCITRCIYRQADRQRIPKIAKDGTVKQFRFRTKDIDMLNIDPSFPCAPLTRSEAVLLLFNDLASITCNDKVPYVSFRGLSLLGVCRGLNVIQDIVADIGPSTSDCIRGRLGVGVVSLLKIRRNLRVVYILLLSITSICRICSTFVLMNLNLVARLFGIIVCCIVSPTLLNLCDNSTQLPLDSSSIHPFPEVRSTSKASWNLCKSLAMYVPAEVLGKENVELALQKSVSCVFYNNTVFGCPLFILSSYLLPMSYVGLLAVSMLVTTTGLMPPIFFLGTNALLLGVLLVGFIICPPLLNFGVYFTTWIRLSGWLALGILMGHTPIFESVVVARLLVLWLMDVNHRTSDSITEDTMIYESKVMRQRIDSFIIETAVDIFLCSFGSACPRLSVWALLRETLVDCRSWHDTRLVPLDVFLLGQHAAHTSTDESSSLTIYLTLIDHAFSFAAVNFALSSTLWGAVTMVKLFHIAVPKPLFFVQQKKKVIFQDQGYFEAADHHETEETEDPYPGLTRFLGTWQVNLAISDSMDGVSKSMGVSWAIRKAFAKFTPSCTYTRPAMRKILITSNLPFGMTKESELILDNVEHTVHDKDLGVWISTATVSDNRIVVHRHRPKDSLFLTEIREVITKNQVDTLHYYVECRRAATGSIESSAHRYFVRIDKSHHADPLIPMIASFDDLPRPPFENQAT